MGIYQTIAPADGGHLALTIAPTRFGSEADALEAALADMSAAYSSDFANGRMGNGTTPTSTARGCCVR